MLLLLLAGFIVAILSAGLGIGGGVFTVPLLIYTGRAEAFPAEFLGQMAVANSLVTAMVLSLSASVSYYLKGQVELRAAFLILAGNMAGAVAGSVYGGHLKSEDLVLLFSVFIGLNGIYTFYKVYSKSKIPLNLEPEAKGFLIVYKSFTMPLIGIFIGFFSSIIGIGGGLFMVPVFTYIYRMSVHKAIATSAFCIVFTALSGIAGYSVLVTADTAGFPGPSLGYLYFPYLFPLLAGAAAGGAAGSRISMKLKPRSLEIIYGLLQLIISAKMSSDLLF